MPQDYVEELPQTDWYSGDVATFGDRLAAAREAAGLQQGEFAKRLGVKKRTVADWEADLNEPRANRLQMMAGLLNVSVGWLLTGDGDGVDSPMDGVSQDADMLALMTEIRDIRTQVKHELDRLGRVEKALRLRMKQSD